MKRLFVDLDGVMADLDSAIINAHGHFPDRNSRAANDAHFWNTLLATPNLFENLDPMPQSLEMWNALKQFNPIILTGVPKSDPERTARDKHAWVKKHLGEHVPFIACRSAEKRLHGAPGDILLDDWAKHLPKWEAMGGIAVLHDPTNPLASVAKIVALMA